MDLNSYFNGIDMFKKYHYTVNHFVRGLFSNSASAANA